MKHLGALLLFFFGNALAQSQCVPSSPENTKVVASGSLKTVEGTLADFDPCHRSVQLNTPSLFAKKRGDKPPVVIIVHGGGGIGGYEREFAKLMNQNGFATLLYDAFEMNGLTSGSNLVLNEMRNSARQRMIYKATVGAYQWVLKNDKVDVKDFCSRLVKRWQCCDQHGGIDRWKKFERCHCGRCSSCWNWISECDQCATVDALWISRCLWRNKSR